MVKKCWSTKLYSISKWHIGKYQKINSSSGIAVAYSHYIHKKLTCLCFVCFAQHKFHKIPKVFQLSLSIMLQYLSDLSNLTSVIDFFFFVKLHDRKLFLKCF